MPRIRSTAAILNDINLVVQAAKTYAKELPAETAKIAKELGTVHADLLAQNAAQEKAKQDLAKLTEKLKAGLKDAEQQRARIIRYAEATFGPRDPRVQSFRPKTEGTKKPAPARKKKPA
jgi:septal ring factor EnvC (AmiA/AmiB activator)